jgi:hypothetical protein
VIRTVVARYLAGESTASLTTWLQQGQDVPPVSGKTWSTTTVRNMLRSERNAGLRVHKGETVPATWKPIVDEADRQRVLARMSRNAATGKRTPRRYLLSGLLRCSDCGHKLYSERRKDKGRYACRSGPDFGGCGKRSIVAGPVEDLVTAAVLYRLDTPELADALTGRAAEDDKTAALAEDLAADRVQLVELAQLYGDKAITAREWIEARNPIEARITNTERRLARQTRSDALTGWVGNSDALRSAWDDLSLTVRAAIVSSIVDHADIAPGQRGARELDPNRVDIVWRL